jgi:HNH endonuclease
VVAEAQCEWRSQSLLREHARSSTGRSHSIVHGYAHCCCGRRAIDCWESPKPAEFGNAGQNWEDIGWRVKVAFTQLINRLRPKDHIGLLRSLLPSKYSPLQANGNGLQSVYLTEIPAPLAEVLFGLIGAEVEAIRLQGAGIRPIPADDLDSWEAKIAEKVQEDTTIPETDRLAIVRARKGQGLFRERVGKIEARCRITGVENPAHLVASHCKPWRDATNEERLDGENGLLLTPSIDHLFDRGFIGFEDSGRLIISPVAHRPSLQRMGIAEPINVGQFTSGQRKFLDFHRQSVLLKSMTT